MYHQKGTYMDTRRDFKKKQENIEFYSKNEFVDSIYYFASISYNAYSSYLFYNDILLQKGSKVTWS